MTAMLGTAVTLEPLWWCLFLSASTALTIGGGRPFWWLTALLGTVSAVIPLVFFLFSLPGADFTANARSPALPLFAGGLPRFFTVFPLASWCFCGIEGLTLACDEVREVRGHASRTPAGWCRQSSQWGPAVAVFADFSMRRRGLTGRTAPDWLTHAELMGWALSVAPPPQPKKHMHRGLLWCIGTCCLAAVLIALGLSWSAPGVEYYAVAGFPLSNVFSKVRQTSQVSGQARRRRSASELTHIKRGLLCLACSRISGLTRHLSSDCLLIEPAEVACASRR